MKQYDTESYTDYSYRFNEEPIEFSLFIKNEEIAKISVSCDFPSPVWLFWYTESFKRSGACPITDFPDINKVYECSGEPWAFLRIRVPDPTRSDVKKRMDELEISESDWVKLLENFGRVCISNPYRLERVPRY